MRIKSISGRGFAPIKLFEIDDLKDVVLIAGPNGVDKKVLYSARHKFASALR